MLATLPDECRQSQADARSLTDVLAAFHPRAEVSVEIADSNRLANLDAHWSDLLQRADVHNAFMAPRLLLAAAEAGTQIVTLLAWRPDVHAPRLVGLWAFSIGRPRGAIVPFKALRAPATEHAYLATPVIDRTCVDATLAAMLDALAAAPHLPKTVMLCAMSAEMAGFLQRVIASRRAHACVFNETQRPALAVEADPEGYLQSALSSSTRKKLRQYRRRLGERGKLELHVAQSSEDVRGAAEQFLQLEAQGWKGRRGTALLSQAQDAAFMRGMLSDLAERKDACIYSLMLDGRPVSMQIVLRAGPAAFTWKTAYDEALGELSPGMLLFEDYTKALLAEPGVTHVDSCAYDDQSFMASWKARARVLDLMFDVRKDAPLQARLSASINCWYRGSRGQVKSLWHRCRACLKTARKGIEKCIGPRPAAQPKDTRCGA